MSIEEPDFSIVGLGIDAEKISRFDGKILGRKNFLKKIYTPAELRYCLTKRFPAPHLAVRFAGKEAVYKALPDLSAKKRLWYSGIEIKNQRTGAPFVTLRSSAFKGYSVLLSLTHTDEFAFAVALVRRRKTNEGKKEKK